MKKRKPPQPKCGHSNADLLQTNWATNHIRRLYQCTTCFHKFHTFEILLEIKQGEKLVDALRRTYSKRPPNASLDKAIGLLERFRADNYIE